MRHASLWIASAVVLITASPASAWAQAQVDRGMKVYGEQKCSICHSIAGKGNPKGVLNDIGARLSAEEIRQWLVDPDAMRKKHNAERKPPMKSYKTLSKEDLDGLVAYLQTLKAK